MEIALAVVADMTFKAFDLFSYRRNVGELLRKMEVLSSLRSTVQVKLDASYMDGNMITLEIARWMEDVNKILFDAEELIFKVEDATSCFKGWGCGRCYLSRKVKRLSYKISEYLNEIYKLDISNLVSIRTLSSMPAENFEEDDSNKEATEKVMEALSHDKINIIGVYGLGGVGKTTIMRKIANQVKEENLFDTVVMVSVTQNPDLRKIQDKIAKELSLEFGPDIWELRARKLFTKLKHENKVLIILDDMWMKLDLTEVGIPVGKFHNGCKVILTTRSKEVCEMMETQAEISLGYLSEQASWQLLKKSAGIDASFPNEVVKDVVRESKGLPLALITLGKALRGKDESVWADALLELRKHSYAEGADRSYFEGGGSEVFNLVKLSYDYMPNEETKFILLYCCMFPESYQIGMDELLMYLTGEDIFKEADLDGSKRILHSVIDHLMSAGLLQKANLDGFVMMHDVVRDVAIAIASEDHGFVVNAGTEYKAWPNYSLQNCIRLSLIGSGVSELPVQPECPDIKTLTLSRCQSLKIIPDSFFEGMKSLVNLDLSHTPIVALPSSIKCLENLRTLCLDGCSALKDVSVIGKLKTLEIISLKKTSTEKLPVRELREFPNLKLIALENWLH